MPSTWMPDSWVKTSLPDDGLGAPHFDAAAPRNERAEVPERGQMHAMAISKNAVERDGNLLKRRVARAFAKPVDRHARGGCPRLYRRNRVGRCKSEVVVAMKLDGEIGHCPDRLDGCARRKRVDNAKRIGETVAGRASLGRGFQDRLQGLAACSRGVLAAERNFEALRSCIADDVSGRCNDACERAAKLRDDLRMRHRRGQVDNADAGCDRVIDIAAPHAAPGHDADRKPGAGNPADRLLLFGAHRRRAGFDLIHARVGERRGDLKFFVQP